MYKCEYCDEGVDQFTTMCIPCTKLNKKLYLVNKMAEACRYTLHMLPFLAKDVDSLEFGEVMYKLTRVVEYYDQI